MGLHRIENQYRGVNAHLHSHFQRRGGWGDFHKDHMEILSDELRKALPAESYAVTVMPSLQIAHYDLFADDAGVGVSKIQPQPSESAAKIDLADGLLTAQQPTLVLPVTNLFLEQHEISSVVIYKISGGESSLTTRIEMLSPASKPSGSHHYQYRVKRSEVLRTHIKLIELDYLHERRSIVFELPDYTQNHPDAHPYSILVSELQSVTGAGRTDVYAFHVEDAIPVIELPLDEGEVLTFDFGKVYHRAFSHNTLNGLRYVDYSVPPEGIETYTDEDQNRIRMRMELAAKLQM